MFIKPQNRGYIYLLTFGNGKAYIGQTVHFANRMFAHQGQVARGTNRRIYNGWRKHGLVSSEIIFVCHVDDLDMFEGQLIAAYDSFNNGYNSTTGGEHKPMICSDVRERISETLKERFKTDPVHAEEHRQRSKRRMQEKLEDPEYKAEMAARFKALVHNPEVKAANIERTRARNKTPESRSASSERMKRTRSDPEFYQKWYEARWGNRAKGVHQN